jgi:hypothetical protein
MIAGFTTKNSTYMFNEKEKVITGGIFRDNWVRYTSIQAIQGTNAIINLADGRIVRTGRVENYV